MTLTIQQFYRIAVQQLPELETKPLIQHVVRLYAEVLNPRYAFVFTMQGDELIFAANKPHDALVSEIKRNFKASDGASSIQIETIQLESNYFTVYQLDETFVFALGFNEPVLDEELVMLQEVSSALAVRMKLLAAQTRNSLFQQCSLIKHFSLSNKLSVCIADLLSPHTIWATHSSCFFPDFLWRYAFFL
jgi:hypothetical protein